MTYIILVTTKINNNKRFKTISGCYSCFLADDRVFSDHKDLIKSAFSQTHRLIKSHKSNGALFLPFKNNCSPCRIPQIHLCELAFDVGGSGSGAFASASVKARSR